MGLLDDAIREHLDLKRRSGGDPAEIERLEREALGPVRRDPTAAAPTATAYEEPPTEYIPAHNDDERDEVPRAQIIGSVPEEQPKRRGFLHRRAAPPSEPDSALPEPEQSSLGADLDESPAGSTAEPIDHDDEPEPRRLPTVPDMSDQSARPVSPIDEPTVEHQVVDADDYSYADDADPRPKDANDHPTEDKPEAAGQAEDDVLEETPEFLQDTPEHDRLWFEQRPPKDFDFDG